MKQILTALLATGLLAVAACGASDGEGTANAEPAATNPQETAEVQDTPATASEQLADFVTRATEEMRIGNTDAKLTLIEYASVTCPGCAYFHEEIYPRLKTDYIDTGRVNFVFREFPTPPEQLAYLGFVLSRCVADEAGPDAYFAMVGTLFKNQRSWVSEAYGDELLKYAAQAGLSQEGFEACIQREDILTAINDNIETGRAEHNVSSTPTFIMNGETMGRYTNVEEYFTLLDAALEQAEAQ